MNRRQWLEGIQSSRQLPQSAKRYAEWLLRRPIPQAPGLYKGGQHIAAKQLGMSDRTVGRCEDLLIANGHIRLAHRGCRRRAYSVFAIPIHDRLASISGSKTGTRGRVLDGSKTRQNVVLIDSANVTGPRTSQTNYAPTTRPLCGGLRRTAAVA